MLWLNLYGIVQLEKNVEIYNSQNKTLVGVLQKAVTTIHEYEDLWKLTLFICKRNVTHDVVVWRR